jgi:hypothetical protein
MNSGRFVLSQVLDLVHRQTLDRLVERTMPNLASDTSVPASNSSAWSSHN